MKSPNILVTGRPGVGKTTLLETLCRNLDGFHPVGFYTSPKPLIATVAAKGGGMIAAVKRRTDVELVHVTERNRDRLVEDLQQRLLDLLPEFAD
jgi:nucleoside-triphosphatase THEP1